MKNLMMAVLGLMLFIGLTSASGCDTPPSADQVDQNKQEIIQTQAVKAAGMPNIDKFTELKLVNLIYEFRDNPALINYAYLQSEMTGKLIYIGKCVGYPIPYATQRSNPEKYVQGNTSEYSHTLPQAEPNGLFMPASADGTWVMMIDPAGKPRVCYFEPKVTVLPYQINM